MLSLEGTMKSSDDVRPHPAYEFPALTAQRSSAIGSATFDEVEPPRYRFDLQRRVATGGEFRVVFVMLNPSSADETHDDPTLRRCRGFAASWGATELAVVNLFPWIASNPADLGAREARGYDIRRGLLNEAFVEYHLLRADRVVAAWGGWSRRVACRHILNVVSSAALRSSADGVQCLGVNQNGTPKHPLYARRDTELLPFVGGMA